LTNPHRTGASGLVVVGAANTTKPNQTTRPEPPERGVGRWRLSVAYLESTPSPSSSVPPHQPKPNQPIYHPSPMAAAPTSHQLAAGAPWSSLPRGGFRALTDSAPASVRFSVGRRRAARLEVKAAGNIFGDYFQVATYGESHGGGVGCVISGCPPRIPLTEEDMQGDLDRRRPGQSRITTPRKETDTCKILSGTYE
uniref:chorismate synthase n=1 Tax=Aegilops tauschii subsp. strangulata TaxID=200361 RepID=A0A453IH60_AEGTS